MYFSYFSGDGSGGVIRRRVGAVCEAVEDM